MNEIWKSIEGYEGLYEVSNLGRVKSLKIGKEKILKPLEAGRGRFYVELCKNGEPKKMKVHRLVGRAFVPGWFEGAVINHKDHDPSNNVCANLEWTTQKDNSSREKSFAPEICAKLFSKKVLQFTKSGEFVREWPSLAEIKRQLGFNRNHICECCNGKRKSAYKYVWRYKSASSDS